MLSEFFSICLRIFRISSVAPTALRGLGRRDDIDVFVAQDVLHVHPEDGPLLDFHVALDVGFQHDFIAGRQEFRGFGDFPHRDAAQADL